MLRELYETIRLPPFENSQPRLCVLDDQQMQTALDMAVEEFGRFVPPESVRPTLHFVCPSLSFGIVAGDSLIGAYLVSEKRLRDRNLALLDNRRALQGEALVVHQQARGLGFGSILRATLARVACAVGADYVWGGALVELGNLDHWLRRRVLVYRGSGLNITLEPIATDLKQALLPLAGGELKKRWRDELGLNPTQDALASPTPSSP